MSLAMTQQEREAFLAETRIGVVSIPEERRGPLTVPVWYAYKPGGEIRFVIDKESQKAKLLSHTNRISICIHDDSLPYRYVSIEGPFTLDTADTERDIRGIARNYLGSEGADQHTERVRGRDSVLVQLHPERWYSVDFGKLN